MKKFFKVLGWVFLGVFLQFKFSVLYGIVFLENLNFHDRSYFVKMKLVPASETIRLLQVETIVHHSLGSDYFANVYIPLTYNVLNKKPYAGTETIQGYRAYKMNMKRKYRDVLSAEDFIIAPSAPDEEIPALPILIHFENLNQRLHTDKTYKLSSVKNDIRLEGPEIVEATYPQKLGM
ncbi:hypothetical protein UZ36_01000 [Candidatus Nitromaritima sp. SCGC AAA799-C22]|nr:hypothetical protein UZ36_01000 [Candidatus Nitromaritima sp. SCGC AAA799-C22]